MRRAILLIGIIFSMVAIGFIGQSLASTFNHINESIVAAIRGAQ